MIKYKKEEKIVEVDIYDTFICDKCGKEITDDLEWEETYMIRFVGGYVSVFGGENKVSCDLCQQCLYELIGDFCRYNEGE